MFNKLKKFLKSKKAVGSVATAIKVGTACVLGATILVGGVALTNDVILPSTSDKAQAIADYEGGGSGGGSTGGVAPVNVPIEQGITDLTGTTWELSDIVTLPQNSISLNFSVNSTGSEFFGIDGGDSALRYFDGGDYNPFYYEGGGWTMTKWKTLAISGGTDATNPDVIAWFEANGTLVE